MKHTIISNKIVILFLFAHLIRMTIQKEFRKSNMEKQTNEWQCYTIAEFRSVELLPNNKPHEVNDGHFSMLLQKTNCPQLFCIVFRHVLEDKLDSTIQLQPL